MQVNFINSQVHFVINKISMKYDADALSMRI